VYARSTTIIGADMPDGGPARSTRSPAFSRELISHRSSFDFYGFERSTRRQSVRLRARTSDAERMRLSSPASWANDAARTAPLSRVDVVVGASPSAECCLTGWGTHVAAPGSNSRERRTPRMTRTSIEITAISRNEVAELLPPIRAQIDLVERTYVAMAAGGVELPPKPGIHPRPNAFIHAMPAYLRESDVAAIKWVSGYPSNRERGLPYISGIIIVNDPETGLPTGLMDAAEITAARTAAASGACIRSFAPSGWTRAAILGCGEQGQYHALVLVDLNPNVVIQAYDPESSRANALPGDVRVMSSPRGAVEGAEVIITAGPIVEAPAPVISIDWLSSACLLLPIDFDCYVQHEVIEASELFIVDDIEQYQYYCAHGHFQRWPAPRTSTGEALSGDERYDRVACVNLGVGALDAAFADLVLSAANTSGTGVKVTL
jgi:alanine dehydrogenase